MTALSPLSPPFADVKATLENGLIILKFTAFPAKDRAQRLVEQLKGMTEIREARAEQGLNELLVRTRKWVNDEQFAPRIERIVAKLAVGAKPDVPMGPVRLNVARDRGGWKVETDFRHTDFGLPFSMLFVNGGSFESASFDGRGYNLQLSAYSGYDSDVIANNARLFIDRFYGIQPSPLVRQPNLFNNTVDFTCSQQLNFNQRDDLRFRLLDRVNGVDTAGIAGSTIQVVPVNSFFSQEEVAVQAEEVILDFLDELS